MSEKSLDWTDTYLKINVLEFVNQVDMRCEERETMKMTPTLVETKDLVS